MAITSLPKLTQAHVRKLTTAQGFERGQRYLKDGAIIEPVLQGHEPIPLLLTLSVPSVVRPTLKRKIAL